MTLGWAVLVTVHPLPGVGVLEGVKGVMGEGKGCVLVAEMSSEGNLATGEYTKGQMTLTFTASFHECVSVGRSDTVLINLFYSFYMYLLRP